MSKKIGQALVERGIIDRAQLRAALELQLIHGGHLGSSLIELGLVDEASLGRALAEIQGVPYAARQMFLDIPPEILARLPKALVRERWAVPIGLEGRSLHVATVERRNLNGLSTITGCRIVPYVAPEVRIVQAMEEYYGIPRRARYLRLSGGPGKAGARAAASPEAQAASEGDPHAVDTHQRLHELSARMSRVESHAELGELILDFSACNMERSILFDASGENAGVVDWRGFEPEAGRVRSVTLPINAESLFGLALETSWYYRGPLPDDFDARSFYGTLDLEPPREILILPIYGADRLAAVLYGDGGPGGRVRGSTESYLALLDRIDLALRMLSLKLELAEPLCATPLQATATVALR